MKKRFVLLCAVCLCTAVMPVLPAETTVADTGQLVFGGMEHDGAVTLQDAACFLISL